MDVVAVSAVLEALGGVLVVAVGYGVTWAIWHYIFSPRNQDGDDGEDRWRSP
jgi:hypothetical protein